MFADKILRNLTRLLAEALVLFDADGVGVAQIDYFWE
jgi:hypothetical protein